MEGSKEHASPDDDVFQHLATVYATNHATMSNGKPCKGAREGFPNGIINGLILHFSNLYSNLMICFLLQTFQGAAWYAVTGQSL